MEINLKHHNHVQVVEIIGDLDSSTATTAQNQIVPLIQPGSRVVLDMSHVPFMSSAGLRVLLLLYRKISSSHGKVVLVGLSDDLRDTMFITGFLEFFTTYHTLHEGIEAVSH